MITIRPFERADKPALYQMLRDIWPSETEEALDRRWWWDFPVAPLTLASDGNGTLAGMVGNIPFDLWTSGRQLRGSWIVDYFVLPSHQGQGIGKKLVNAVKPRFDFLASLNQTDAAYAAFSRLGWTERRFVPFFIAASPTVFRILSRIPSLGRRIRVDIRSGKPSIGVEYDDLWTGSRDHFEAIALRSRAALENRFGMSRRSYEVIEARRSGRLEGYCVVRELPPGSIRSFPRYPILMISDYLANPGDTELFTCLIYEASRVASRRKIRFMLCMSVHEPHQRVLSRAGFLSAGTPVVGNKLRKLAVGFTATPDAPAGRWHLTPFDCDLDILFGSGS